MIQIKDKKNKKGDIPTTILVLGVVVICVFAIVSFSISLIKVNKNFDLTAIKEVKLIKEKAEFYENIGFSKEEIDSILGIKEDSQGRYVLLDDKIISARYYFPRG